MKLPDGWKRRQPEPVDPFAPRRLARRKLAVEVRRSIGLGNDEYTCISGPLTQAGPLGGESDLLVVQDSVGNIYRVAIYANGVFAPEEEDGQAR